MAKNKVIINSVIYTISGLLTKCFSFFLLPLYTVYLTTEDYGINSIASTFITTVSFVVAFSLFSAIKRFYVDLKDDEQKLKRFYGTVFCFVILSGLFFVLLFTLLRGFLVEHIFSGVDFYPVIFVCLISLVFNCTHMIFDNILRSQQKALKSSIFSFAYFILAVTLNILFVVVFKMGALGTLLSTLTVSFLYTLYFVIEMLIKKTIKFCIDWKLLKGALKYSIPIMPHDLSTRIAVLVSKVFIGSINETGLALLGIYTIAEQFGAIADNIHYYVNSAYGPWLYEKLKVGEDGYKKEIRQTVKLIIAIIGLMLIGLSLLSQDYILLFLDKGYADAWRFVPLVICTYTVKTMYYFYVEILLYYKQASQRLFIATLTGSLLNVGLSAIFIPMWGVYGSIIADIVSMIVRIAVIVIISKKFDDVGLKIRDFIINFATVMLFVGAGLLPSFLHFGNDFSILNFIYKVLLIVVYVAMIFIIYRKQIRVFLAKKKRNKTVPKESTL